MPPPLKEVYTGHIIPIMIKEGKVVHVTKAPIKEFNEVVNELLGSIVKYSKFVLKELYGEEVGDLSCLLRDLNKLSKYLMQINNYIIGFFKLAYAPISIPRASKEGKIEVFESPLSPYELYWLWSLTRISSELEKLIWRESIVKMDSELLLYKLVYKLSPGAEEALLDLTKPLIDLTEFDRRIKVILHVPADTRPGLNTSKLIPHLLSVSALSVAKYMNKYGYGVTVEREILRLASILHDIGKPIAWIHGISHVGASKAIAEKLEGIIPREVLNVVIKLIESHHVPERLPDYEHIGGYKVKLKELGKILNESDKESSTLDRLVDLVSGYLSRELGISEEEIRRNLVGVGEPVWRFWYEKLGYEKVRELTEKVCKELLKETTKPPQLKGNPISGVALLSIDVKGIQRFISRESLRMLTASSEVINLFTLYIIPRALEEYLNLPPENIVYAGGGFVIVIIPRKIKNEVVRLRGYINECKDRVLSRNIDIGFIIASEDLYSDWPTSMHKLTISLNLTKKISIEASYSTKLGITVNCELCRAKKAVEINEFNALVCRECKEIWEIGKSLYIGTRLKRLKAYGYEVGELRELSKVMGNLIQWFSGHKDWPKGIGGEIAIVKADGNLMGRFMASAISLTDAMERSIRIDWGLKKGISELLDKLKGDNEALKRVYVGLMYAGGDDFLAIWPSYIALPAALYIAYWFWCALGGQSQLSIGIAVGKPKHNIWALLDSSNHLLDEAKKLSRTLIEEGHSELLKNTIAMISFMHSEQQLFPSDVEYSLNIYRGKNLSIQPYALIVPDNIMNIYSLGYGVINDLITIVNGKSNKVRELLENFIKLALKVREKSISEVGILKHLRALTMELNNIIAKYSPSKNVNDMKLTTLTYLSREAIRLKEIIEVEEARRIVIHNVVEVYIKANIMPPLYDLFTFSKILMGGIV